MILRLSDPELLLLRSILPRVKSAADRKRRAALFKKVRLRWAVAEYLGADVKQPEALVHSDRLKIDGEMVMILEAERDGRAKFAGDLAFNVARAVVGRVQSKNRVELLGTISKREYENTKPTPAGNRYVAPAALGEGFGKRPPEEAAAEFHGRPDPAEPEAEPAAVERVSAGAVERTATWAYREGVKRVAFLFAADEFCCRFCGAHSRDAWDLFDPANHSRLRLTVLAGDGGAIQCPAGAALERSAVPNQTAISEAAEAFEQRETDHDEQRIREQ